MSVVLSIVWQTRLVVHFLLVLNTQRIIPVSIPLIRVCPSYNFYVMMLRLWDSSTFKLMLWHDTWVTHFTPSFFSRFASMSLGFVAVTTRIWTANKYDKKETVGKRLILINVTEELPRIQWIIIIIIKIQYSALHCCCGVSEQIKK